VVIYKSNNVLSDYNYKCRNSGDVYTYIYEKGYTKTNWVFNIQNLTLIKD